jgi:hypothetical protein
LLVQETRPRLRELTQIIQAFVSILSHAQNTELAAIPVPLQLIRAWVHLVLALVKADGESSNVGYYLGQGHLDFAIALIKEGMAEVMQALPSGDLLSNEVLLPMDVVSLLSLKLLQDSTGALPNIDKTYSEYLHAMVQISSYISAIIPTALLTYYSRTMKSRPSPQTAPSSIAPTCSSKRHP